MAIVHMAGPENTQLLHDARVLLLAVADLPFLPAESRTDMLATLLNFHRPFSLVQL